MQYVILVGGRNFSLKSFDNMQFYGSTCVGIYDGDLLVQYENGYARFTPDDDIAYIEEESAKIPFAEPKCITLRYNDIGILRSIISEKDFPEEVMIDCDGVYLGLEDVIDSGRLINNYNISEV